MNKEQIALELTKIFINGSNKSKSQYDILNIYDYFLNELAKKEGK